MNTQYTVYAITNINTGRQYFGSTGDLAERWGSHKFYLAHNRHTNPGLQEAKNAGDELQYSIVRKGLTEDEADRLERKMIKQNPDCYNIRKRGKGSGSTPKYITEEGYGKAHRPLFSKKEVKEILALRGSMFGYEIAEIYNVSPSLISSIFTGKYGSYGTTVRPR